VQLVETSWLLDDDGPVLEGTREFQFSKKDTSWELYDPGSFRALSLLPSVRSPERIPPVAFAGGSHRLRIGSREFTTADGILAADNGAVALQGPSYWEDIQAQGPYRVKSRRRVVSIGRRFQKVRRYDDSSSAENSNEDASESAGADDLSYGVTSPGESWSSASASSMQESDSESSSNPREAAKDSPSDSEESKENQSEDPEEDNTSGSESGNAVSSTDLGLGGLPGEADSDESIGFCEWSESEEGSKYKKPNINSVQQGKKKGRFWTCNGCEASEMKRFYQCELCAKENTFDLCQGCIDQSKWCRDKFHVLSKMRLNSRGRPRHCGWLWLNDCRSGRCLIVERLDASGADLPVIFRFQGPESSSKALFDSPPRMHPTKPLLVWPLGGWQMLYADIEANKYFVRPSHGPFQGTYSKLQW
jgi:hypothetical protein